MVKERTHFPSNDGIPLRPDDEPTFGECLDGMPVDEYTSAAVWDEMYGPPREDDFFHPGWDNKL